MEWSTACEDWETRIVEGKPLIKTPVLFPLTAEHAVENIFKELRIVDMVGRPTIGEVTKDWVFDFANVFFGSMDDEANVRHIREFMLLIAKKNTKSTIAAGIMLTVLITNLRESAEFLVLAPTVDAAKNVFKPASDMIRADEDLDALFHVQEHIRTITNRISKATLKVVAADTDAVSGSKATGILIDELWAFGKKAKARSMLTEATGGLMSRKEGFVMYLTTQSDEPPAGIFKEKLSYARKVRDGEIDDPQFLPVLYEYPPAMVKAKGYEDSKNYYVTNPNLGASVDEPYLQRKITQAVEGGEESIQEVYAKHLNVEIGLNLRSDRWLGAEYWEAATEENLGFEEIIERSEVITVGVDGGGLNDLLGLCVLGRCRDTSQWLAWGHAWAHPKVLERYKKEAGRFRDFEEQGDLTIYDRVGDDVQHVANIVEEIFASDLLYKVGVDPVGIGDILDALEEREIPNDKIAGISQGWKLGGAIKTSERRLSGGELVHCKQPLMSWCVSNARVEPRANSILITKHASGYAKIDPLIGLLNAVQLMSLNPAAQSTKYQLMVM